MYNNIELYVKIIGSPPPHFPQPQKLVHNILFKRFNLEISGSREKKKRIKT